MTRLGIAPLAAAFIAAATPPAGAGEAQDRIFRVGLLGDVRIGERLVYGRVRNGTASPETAPAVVDGAVIVTVVEGDGGARVAQVDVRGEGQADTRAMLPADGGHPVMLLFLESTARTVAEATGGSPFYIRNRMREALGENVALEPVEVTLTGETIAAQAATFRPFDEDPNRGSMGPFADLALTMVLSDAVPGGFARFEAAAGAGEGGAAFTDTLVFERLEEE